MRCFLDKCAWFMGDPTTNSWCCTKWTLEVNVSQMLGKNSLLSLQHTHLIAKEHIWSFHPNSNKFCWIVISGDSGCRIAYLIGQLSRTIAMPLLLKNVTPERITTNHHSQLLQRERKRLPRSNAIGCEANLRCNSEISRACRKPKLSISSSRFPWSMGTTRAMSGRVAATLWMHRNAILMNLIASIFSIGWRYRSGSMIFSMFLEEKNSWAHCCSWSTFLTILLLTISRSTTP